MFNPRRPVTGGRWKIRRYPVGPVGKPWFARTEGKASKWNRRFATAEEAIQWAHYVADMYKRFPKATADAAIGLALRYDND